MLRKILLAISISLFSVMAIIAQGTSTTTSTTPAAATTKSTKTPAFRPTKDQVKQGQTMLKDKKLYDGEATGIYNDPTRAAIKSFQKANGLEENGKFDKPTLEKMNIALTDKQKGMPSTTSPVNNDGGKTVKTTALSTTSGSSNTVPSDGPKKPAPFQANKDQIMALQKTLKDAKMFTGEADGERSDALKEAVKKYQEANFILVTGGINAATLEKMGIALTDAQKANVAAQATYDAAKAPKN